MTNPINPLSRRNLLRGAAVLSGAKVISACGGGDNTPAGPNPDILQLNALLVAEYGAVATYDAGIRILNAPSSGDPLAMYSLALSAIATQWQSQHSAHATALVAAIRAIGGTPANQASTPPFTAPPNFTNTVTNVLKLAANAEKGAAITYNNTVATLTSQTNRLLAANIEGDESQHFIVLYALLNGLATPGAALAAMGTANVVPRAFVAATGGGDMTTSLEGVADFTYT